jgi:DNA-binding FrmR family transcriptional regulator
MAHRHHEQTDAVIKRLSRIEGHVSGIKKMVLDYKECDQILIQISAVRSALNEVGKIILGDHMQQCVLEDIREGKTDSYENLKKAIDQYMK